MANQQGNGRGSRDAGTPDEHRASRQDDSVSGRPRGITDDERERMFREREEERFLRRDRERMAAHWDDRTSRWDDRARAYRPWARSDARSRDWGMHDRSGVYPMERAYDPTIDYGVRRSHDGSGYEDDLGGDYLAQGGQEMGYGQPGSYGRDARRGGYGREPSEVESRHGYGAPGFRRWRQVHEPQLGPRPSNRGKGPAGYTRSDERIREMVCEVLTEDEVVDATHVEVTVETGEVTLSGTVVDRHQKRHAEDVIEKLPFVTDVHNHLHLAATGPGEPEPAVDVRRRRP